MDFPVQAREQLNFLDDVNLDIILKNTSANLPEDEEIEDFHQMSENLKIIISTLKEGKSAKEKCVQAFPKWKKIRYDTIHKLYEICASKRNCNFYKLIGYSTSVIVAGALTLALAITSIPILGATIPLMMSGAALTITGVGCYAIFWTTKDVLLTKFEQAQELIEEDRNAFTILGNWLNSANEMLKALIEILNMCPYKDITNAIKDLVDKTFGITNRAERIRTIQAALQAIIGDFVDKGTELPLKKIATIISVLVIVFQLLNSTKNRYVFDVALLTVVCDCTSGLNFENFRDIASLTNIVLRENKQHAKNVIEAIVREAMSVETVYDVADIISDVSKGSISLETKKIEKAAEELRKEADKIERLYNYLC